MSDEGRLQQIRQRFERYSAGGWRGLPEDDIAYLLAALTVLQEQLQAKTERVEWFEKSGGVTAHMRVFQEMNRAEAAEALVVRLQEQIKSTKLGCISCGEQNDGGYEVEDGPGPFCSLCWGALQDHFEGSQKAEVVRLQEQAREREDYYTTNLLRASDQIDELEGKLETTEAEVVRLQAQLQEKESLINKYGEQFVRMGDYMREQKRADTLDVQVTALTAQLAEKTAVVEAFIESERAPQGWRWARTEAYVVQLKAAEQRLAACAADGLELAGRLSYAYAHDIPGTEQGARVALLRQLAEKETGWRVAAARCDELSAELHAMAGRAAEAERLRNELNQTLTAYRVASASDSLHGER